MHCTRTKLFNIHVCKGGPNFLGNMPPGGAIFPRKFSPGGPYFGGAKFPGTPEHTRRQIAATRRSNKFCRVNKRILLKILSPRQNFVAATCRTTSNWFNFVRHVAATKFCRGDKILINQASNVEAFTPGDFVVATYRCNETDR